MALRGFILQASYRIAVDRGERIPIVHLHGRLEDGSTFLVRDDRPRPQFYLRAADVGRARAVRMPEPVPVDRRTFAGEPVCRIELPVPGDVPPIRDRLHAIGIDTFEADVRFAVRYLIERGIQGGCEIEGGARPGEGVDHVFDNPLVRPAGVMIAPQVLSFDIETDPKAERLLAISLYANDRAGRVDEALIDEVLIVDGTDRPMPPNARRCATEFDALQRFCERVRKLDPDVLTGWNIIDFDLTTLQRIAVRVRHPFELGRGPGATRLRKAEGYFGSGQAGIPGRLVLDGIDLLRGAFVRMDDYSLDAVARQVLGEGKAVKGDVRDRASEIVHNYRHDLPAFARYARTDARLALEIVQRLNLVDLAFARSRLTGMTPDRVAASIASVDFLYLSELEKRRIVAPTVRSDDARVHVAQQGGHVLEPVTGLHRNVWVFDFTSLYPSLIRTFNIDPLSYVAEPQPRQELIRLPGGAFERAPAILPRLLDELFPRREAAKRAGDGVASNAIKILMNSFYGVLGTPACRFFNPALANAITGTGRELLLWSKRWFESAGFVVLYGDTDSLFVCSGSDDSAAAEVQGRALAVALNADLARFVAERWQVPSRLELKFEKLYTRLFLPPARRSTRGASKRYAGLRSASAAASTGAGAGEGAGTGIGTGTGNGSGSAPASGGTDAGAVEFVGLEVVRRDWTALAKQVQRELYRRLFADQPVDAYLADVVRQVRSGALDDLLVYRKGLRKDAEEYTATTPPHVVAARKSTQPLGRTVSYVITVGGAEPADDVRNPIDREHYVGKQVRPVAEPVLAVLGLDFDRVIGDARQLDLL
ncbi:MAG: DNA-directed DNA polymerase [Lautropia sp.]